MDPVAPARSRPFARAALLLGIAAFVALALIVWHATLPMAWERPVISSFQHRPLPLRNLWVGMFEPVPFAFLAAALACAAAARDQLRLALAGLAGALLAVVLAELVLKPLIDRRAVRIVGVHHHVVRLTRGMFPSAHVTAAASLAMFAWLILDRRARLIPWLAILPLVVGHSVISRGMHYPADVLGGLLLGPIVVYCVVETVDARARRAGSAARASSLDTGDPAPGPPAMFTGASPSDRL